jgi:hypothetical protein
MPKGRDEAGVLGAIKHHRPGAARSTKTHDRRRDRVDETSAPASHPRVVVVVSIPDPVAGRRACLTHMRPGSVNGPSAG